MLYRLKNDVFFRFYDEFGYLVNKANFNEQIINKAGALMVKPLTRRAKTFQEIVGDAAGSFYDAELPRLEADLRDFYSSLEEDAYIVSGESEQELEKKDGRFYYEALKRNTRGKKIDPVMLGLKDTKTYLDEYVNDSPKLMSFQLELTSRCNERCLHCYIPHQNKTANITEELFYHVLEQCAAMGVLDITFSGGEPLLHPNFIDFLQKAKERDFCVTVLSNLTMLNDEIIAALETGALSSVQVSLYSMKAAIHDSITRLPGSLELTKKAILKLIEHNIPVQISCPIMRRNKDGYVDVLNWAQDHNIRITSDFILTARYDHTTDNLHERLDLRETGEIIRGIVNTSVVYQNSVIDVDFNNPKPVQENERVCGVCNTYMCMVSDGRCYPCAGWQGYILGDAKARPLKEIWERSPNILYLRSIRKKDFPQCLSCPDRDFCQVCMVRNANEDPDGNPLHINGHFCKVAALNRDIVLEWKKSQSRSGYAL